LDKIEFSGLKNCIRIANDKIELVAATEIGPQIVRFGFIGDRNEFHGEPPVFYGGHAMRHAPENKERKFPMNKPVAVEEHDKFVRLTQPIEVPTGTQKEMDIPNTVTDNHISIVNRIYNRGLWPVELAPWAYTIMSPGGKGIIPLPPFVPQNAPGFSLLPTTVMSIWCYCDLSDSRLILGKKYVMLKQDSATPGVYKIGMMVPKGWAAYYNNGHLFVATFEYKKGASYPDYNNNVQFWTGPGFEFETLGNLVKLQPGESAEHVENWFLFKDVPEPKNDSDLDQYVLPLIQKAKKSL
jgi:hypothetical protein